MITLNYKTRRKLPSRDTCFIRDDDQKSFDNIGYRKKNKRRFVETWEQRNRLETYPKTVTLIGPLS